MRRRRPIDRCRRWPIFRDRLCDCCSVSTGRLFIPLVSHLRACFLGNDQHAAQKQPCYFSEAEQLFRKYTQRFHTGFLSIQACKMTNVQPHFCRNSLRPAWPGRLCENIARLLHNAIYRYIMILNVTKDSGGTRYGDSSEDIGRTSE